MESNTKSKGQKKSSTDELKVNSNALASNIDKANVLAESFKRAHTLTSAYSHENDRIVSECIRANRFFTHRSNEAFQINNATISNILSSLRPFKSPGPDNIQNVLLKNLLTAAIDKITNIFNSCIKLSHWPSNFKLAKVIPILKPGKNPAEASSYRPISLLNSMGKPFEKVIY